VFNNFFIWTPVGFYSAHRVVNNNTVPDLRGCTTGLNSAVGFDIGENRVDKLSNY